MKPIVHYRRYKDHSFIIEGSPAIVIPIDHPDTKNVSNTREVVTSKVLSYDHVTGEFETENSRYVPVSA